MIKIKINQMALMLHRMLEVELSPSFLVFFKYSRVTSLTVFLMWSSCISTSWDSLSISISTNFKLFSSLLVIFWTSASSINLSRWIRLTVLRILYPKDRLILINLLRRLLLILHSASRLWHSTEILIIFAWNCRHIRVLLVVNRIDIWQNETLSLF